VQAPPTPTAFPVLFFALGTCGPTSANGIVDRFKSGERLHTFRFAAGRCPRPPAFGQRLAGAGSCADGVYEAPPHAPFCFSAPQ